MQLRGTPKMGSGWLPLGPQLVRCSCCSKDIRVEDSPKPQITDPGDALIKITSAAICGSDLHMYVGQMPGNNCRLTY